jgi:hypothetical protein
VRRQTWTVLDVLQSPELWAIDDDGRTREECSRSYAVPRAGVTYHVLAQPDPIGRTVWLPAAEIAGRFVPLRDEPCRTRTGAHGVIVAHYLTGPHATQAERDTCDRTPDRLRTPAPPPAPRPRPEAPARRPAAPLPGGYPNASISPYGSPRR